MSPVELICALFAAGVAFGLLAALID